MTFLLDVNVLIALVDSAHVNHEAAHAWFAGRKWATCPLVENAFVRIVSNPAYPTIDATPTVALHHLARMLDHPDRVAIADDVSLTDAGLFDPAGIGVSSQVTDVYLLGLAHRHGFRLATFDRRLRHGAVRGATPDSVEQIPA